METSDKNENPPTYCCVGLCSCCVTPFIWLNDWLNTPATEENENKLLGEIICVCVTCVILLLIFAWPVLIIVLVICIIYLLTVCCCCCCCCKVFEDDWRNKMLAQTSTRCCCCFLTQKQYEVQRSAIYDV
ncbi:MAG: hypothetical protein Satyrvirus2_73 [Satyrvirus sp.]|uniref:Uncharacterized protein n=1 Tax=Satyrvirus sp. TaxID=2487771 RepID=A0A3G5AD16_9VIRU|nr:MAG: hypothetical protein Satyrvirus2_73 [Satyrvirus sp.]